MVVKKIWMILCKREISDSDAYMWNNELVKQQKKNDFETEKYVYECGKQISHEIGRRIGHILYDNNKKRRY